MSGRRWRTVAIFFIFLTIIRGVPWFIDTMGTTWGIVFGLVCCSAAFVGVLVTPVTPDAPVARRRAAPEQ